MSQTVQISLIEPQQIIFNSPARFKVVAAGRRLGKTTLAVITCITQALATENSYGDPLGSDSEVVYIGVDREQAKRNAWNMFKSIAREMGVFVSAHENNCVLTVNNGISDTRIRLLGMDRPDSARGMKIRFAVLDEMADMPEGIWEEVIRPALMDTRGGALFIGTPKGKNHFYELYMFAASGEDNEFEAFSFTSRDNSTINEDELDKMALDYARGSPEKYEQEIEGKFISKGGALFHTDDWVIDTEEPKGGSWYVTVDLAGFGRTSGKKNAEIKKLDDTAICIVKAHPTKDNNGKDATGWWVKDIRYGKWATDEVALQILKAYVQHKATVVGIEKGALMNAVYPYLDALQVQNRQWMNIEPLTHGNTAKYDRVQWALQGRVKRGLVTLNKGDWNSVLIEQAIDFPSRLTHDDLLDALAYMDQVAGEWVGMNHFKPQQKWEPTDADAGY